MTGFLTPWITRRPGQEQGRLKDPPGFAQPEGDFALVLGADSANWSARFDIGDSFEVFQSDTISPGKIVRFTGRFRGPSRMPAVSVKEPAAGYVLADGQTLILAIDGGTNQTITFSTAQFVSIGAARAPEVKAAIAGALTSATAFLTGEGVGVLSDTTGRRSRVEVVGGTATALNFQELGWRFQIVLGGTTTVVSRDLAPGEEEDLKDMAGNLADFGDPAEVRFRLILVSL